jgi:ASC-1-like (ASCH) protein
LAADLGVAEVAAGLGRDRSVVVRELARNGGREKYRAGQAQECAEALRLRPKLRKLERDRRLHDAVAGHRPDQPDQRPGLPVGVDDGAGDLLGGGGQAGCAVRVDAGQRPGQRPGLLIRFRCQGDEVLTRVTKVARYTSFEEMFDHESVASVNPLATREEQLTNIRQIYPPEREALGVVALGIELVAPPRLT